MTEGTEVMSAQSSHAQRLAALMGKSVAEQANAGYSASWKRSDLYQSIKTDDDLLNFAEIMSQVVTEDNDEEMQKFYKHLAEVLEDVKSYMATLKQLGLRDHQVQGTKGDNKPI